MTLQCELEKLKATRDLLKIAISQGKYTHDEMALVMDIYKPLVKDIIRAEKWLKMCEK